MLSREKVAEVERLFALGYKQRQISRMTGVSRIVIQRIVTGKRQVSNREPVLFSEGRAGTVERCPSCGRKIQMPCMGCLIQPRNKVTEKNEPVSVDLLPQHRVGYDEIVRWRTEHPIIDFPFGRKKT